MTSFAEILRRGTFNEIREDLCEQVNGAIEMGLLDSVSFRDHLTDALEEMLRRGEVSGKRPR